VGAFQSSMDFFSGRDFSAFPKKKIQKIRKLENDFMNTKSVMEYGN
jgi:hypothetical protein